MRAGKKKAVKKQKSEENHLTSLVEDQCRSQNVIDELMNWQKIGGSARGKYCRSVLGDGKQVRNPRGEAGEHGQPPPTCTNKTKNTKAKKHQENKHLSTIRHFIIKHPSAV